MDKSPDVRRDPLRYAIREALIDFLMAIQDRDKLKTETTWPDQSDIYDETDRKLRALVTSEALGLADPDEGEVVVEQERYRVADALAALDDGRVLDAATALYGVQPRLARYITSFAIASLGDSNTQPEERNTQ